MKILAIETSSKICGACLCEDDRVLDILEIDNGLTHSQNLMPLIQNLLEKNSLKIPEIDAFVCDIGPGSFTGIRIGVATAMAFVDCSENANFTGVNSLETLAYNIKEDGFITSIIDCKNGNCYYALYELKNGEYNEIIPPTAASILEMFETLKSTTNNPITFVGDGVTNYKNEILANMNNAIYASESLNIINTSNLALAGFNKIKNNNTKPLTPLYLKKPQAQRQLEEKK
ncbi:MAG: tRNA (adenosine(37)-N6)-threonylcarbamoyltransferase complex dimerization subunit type 1 TsaB [Clostridia bacterium]|nr:tRNA (adenosine(37)-N6)-threonylcarbamoyltransferase complex dimerization subunit type 1 TsaB [Clostridia bacterium]